MDAASIGQKFHRKNQRSSLLFNNHQFNDCTVQEEKERIGEDSRFSP